MTTHSPAPNAAARSVSGGVKGSNGFTPFVNRRTMPRAETTANGARMKTMNATEESPTPLGLRMFSSASGQMTARQTIQWRSTSIGPMVSRTVAPAAISGM